MMDLELKDLKTSRLFDSIFFNEDGSYNLGAFGVKFDEFGYRYNYSKINNSGILAMYDELGFIFCTIKRSGTLDESIAVRVITDSENLTCQDWIWLNSDSELIDWMMKNRPRVAEWLLWRP